MDSLRSGCARLEASDTRATKVVTGSRRQENTTDGVGAMTAISHMPGSSVPGDEALDRSTLDRSPLDRSPLDRSLGALLGLAVGDALGASVEGRERDSYARLADFAAGGTHGLGAGEWTDDTAMAICLAESLLARGGLDERDLMERFLRWHRLGENCCGGRGAGISTTTRRGPGGFARSGALHVPAER